MNDYIWKERNFPSEKDNCKKIEKNNSVIGLNVLYAKKVKYTMLMFQSITKIVKKPSYSFSDFKWKKWDYCAAKKLSALSRGITSKAWWFSFIL